MKCKECGFSIRSNKNKSPNHRKLKHDAGDHHKKKTLEKA